MFTWWRKWELPRDIRLDGKIIKLDQSTKFLGIYLDSKLSFNEHIKHVTKKVTSLMQCSKAVGPTWGLTPRSCKWIYEKAMRPILSYGSLVWINALQNSEKTQRKCTSKSGTVGTAYDKWSYAKHTHHSA